jgi:hypothetical protein
MLNAVLLNVCVILMIANVHVVIMLIAVMPSVATPILRLKFKDSWLVERTEKWRHRLCSLRLVLQHQLVAGVRHRGAEASQEVGVENLKDKHMFENGSESDHLINKLV